MVAGCAWRVFYVIDTECRNEVKDKKVRTRTKHKDGNSIFVNNK